MRAGRGAAGGGACGAAGDLLEHGADGRVLEVAALPLAARVAREQGLGGGRVEREPDDLFIAGAEFGGGGELGDGPRRGGHPGRAVELDEQVAVAGKDKLDVVARRGQVPLGLVKPVPGRERLLLGLDQGDGDGLRLGVDANAERVVGAARGTPAALAVDDLDGSEGDFAANEILRPATGVDGRVDQFGPGVCLGKGHEADGTGMDVGMPGGEGQYRRMGRRVGAIGPRAGAARPRESRDPPRACRG